jgi:hypothetical protein
MVLVQPGNIETVMVAPTLRYNGVFDFNGLYRMMYNWFFKQRYEFHEDLYKEKVDTIGNELEIKWRAEKKITEFIKYIINVEFHLWNMLDVEVIRNGEKVKMTKARMQIILKASTVADYAKRFEESNMTKRLYHILMTKVLDKEMLLVYNDRLTYITYEFHAEIKKFLGTDTSSNAY